METRQYTVYEYKELSDSAKENARMQHCAACGYDWGDDAIASLKALAGHFNGSLSDWSISWDEPSRSYAKLRESLSL